MFVLSEKELEFSTPLSAETHGIQGLFMWLILDSKWIIFTKTYERIDLSSSFVAVHMDSYKTEGDINSISSDLLQQAKATIRINNSLFEYYVTGESGAENLLANFIRADK
jgi:hypothetical protein